MQIFDRLIQNIQREKFNYDWTMGDDTIIKYYRWTISISVHQPYSTWNPSILQCDIYTARFVL